MLHIVIFHYLRNLCASGREKKIIHIRKRSFINFNTCLLTNSFFNVLLCLSMNTLQKGLHLFMFMKSVYSWKLVFICFIYLNKGYGRMTHQLQYQEMQPSIVAQRSCHLIGSASLTAWYVKRFFKCNMLFHCIVCMIL